MKKVVLISGKLQSGKNYTASYLKNYLERIGYKVNLDLFAKAVKEQAKEDLKDLQTFINETINKIRITAISLKSACNNKLAEDVINDLEKLLYTDDNYYENKTPLTRILLQTYGTNIFRDRVDKNYWVKKVLNRCEEEDYDFKLITDVRFENEIEFFRGNPHFEVVTVRIDRPDFQRESKVNNHISEKSLDDYGKWDHHVLNNSTLEDLKEKLHDLGKNLL